MDILDLKIKLDSVCSSVNEFYAEGEGPLLVKLYPNLDGVINEEQEANIMLLRDSLMNVANICDLALERLAEVFELDANDDD